MREQDLFAAAIGLSSPWFISKVEFRDSDSDIGLKELHIEIDYPGGCRFLCEGETCPVYDSADKTWRHLNFFQHVCYIHARVPRVKMSDGRVVTIDAPWAAPGSSFTLLFEAYTLLLLKSGMSLAAAGRYVNEDSRRLGRIVNRYVIDRLIEEPLEQVENLSVDETSIAKGHKYITVLSNIDKKQVVGIAIGKDSEAVEQASICMEIRGVDKDKVKAVCMDLSPAYISAVSNQFPKSAIVFDRFHLTAMLNKAVDEVRREDQKKNAVLRKSRYIWLKNQSSLNKESLKKLRYLSKACPDIGTAYKLKEQYREIWENGDSELCIELLEEWIEIAWETGLEPIRKFINTLNNHWYGIVEYFNRRISNGFAERVNLKIQEIKRLAKGYRNIDNFINMIYFHLGGFNFNNPQ